MNNILVIILTALGGGVIATILNIIAQRRLMSNQAKKYDAEANNLTVDSMKETVATLRSEVEYWRSENLSLKKEIEKLKREQGKLRKAIEKIQDCEAKNTCPVIKELQNIKND